MVYFGAAPPSWTYPQPVIQHAAPTGKESVGTGKQTGRTPPATSVALVQLERGRSRTAINVPARRYVTVHVLNESLSSSSIA